MLCLKIIYGFEPLVLCALQGGGRSRSCALTLYFAVKIWNVFLDTFSVSLAPSRGHRNMVEEMPITHFHNIGWILWLATFFTILCNLLLERIMRIFRDVKRFQENVWSVVTLMLLFGCPQGNLFVIIIILYSKK